MKGHREDKVEGVPSKEAGDSGRQEVSVSEMVKVKSWRAVGKGFLERWGRRDAEPQRVSLKPEPEVRPTEEDLAGFRTSARSSLAWKRVT